MFMKKKKKKTYYIHMLSSEKALVSSFIEGYVTGFCKNKTKTK